VAQGLVSYSILRPNEAPVEIQTPNASVQPAGAGTIEFSSSRTWKAAWRCGTEQP